MAAYVPALRDGDLVFTSGQLPMVAGELAATGKVGDGEGWSPPRRQGARGSSAPSTRSRRSSPSSATSTRSRRSSRSSASSPATPRFTGQPGVINGASELLGKAFGDTGVHARSAVGVAALPLDAPVEVEIIVAVAESETRHVLVVRGIGERHGARQHPEPGSGARDPGLSGPGCAGAAGARRCLAGRPAAGRAQARGHRHARARRVCAASRSSCCAAWPRWRSRRACMVFPGGGVDPRDGDPRLPVGRPVARRVGDPARDRRGHRPASCSWLPRSARSSRSAACCWPVPPPTPSSPTSAARTGTASASSCSHRARSLAEVLIEQGLVLRSDLLANRAHWITPVFEPRRYDTWFFAAPMPADQSADGHTSEADDRRLGERRRGPCCLPVCR